MIKWKKSEKKKKEKKLSENKRGMENQLVWIV